MSLDDNILRMFIDEVFQVYDFDRSGELDINELHTFFNQLFISLNEPRRFTAEQTRQFVSTFDFQRNGKINKPQLFMLFKNLTSAPTNPNQNNYGGNKYPGNTNNYGQQAYDPYNQPPPNQFNQQPPNQYGNQPLYQKYGQPYQQPSPFMRPPNYNSSQSQQPQYFTFQNNQGGNPNQYNPNNPYK